MRTAIGSDDGVRTVARIGDLDPEVYSTCIRWYGIDVVSIVSLWIVTHGEAHREFVLAGCIIGQTCDTDTSILTGAELIDTVSRDSRLAGRPAESAWQAVDRVKTQLINSNGIALCCEACVNFEWDSERITLASRDTFVGIDITKAEIELLTAGRIDDLRATAVLCIQTDIAEKRSAN